MDYGWESCLSKVECDSRWEAGATGRPESFLDIGDDVLISMVLFFLEIQMVWGKKVRSEGRLGVGEGRGVEGEGKGREGRGAVKKRRCKEDGQ